MVRQILLDWVLMAVGERSMKEEGKFGFSLFGPIGVAGSLLAGRSRVG